MINLKCEIELFEEHQCVTIYTIRFQGEEYTEAESFFLNDEVNLKYLKHLQKIGSWIDKIGETGALERYFRPEGPYGVYALPIESSRLRLYCIRLSNEIVILGNGGVKSTRTWQECPHLTQCVETLISINRFIGTRISKEQLEIRNKFLSGNLTFHIKENEKK